MMASLLIVFREVLEAALIISIVAAVTREVAGRTRWIAGGIGAGVLGAVIVALFADQLAEAMAGMGEEIFHATVLFAAVGLLSWHNLWMARHGRELAAKVGEVGAKVKEGAEPMYALTTVVAVAVLREGSEIVLFLHGIAAAGSGAGDMVLGSLLGLGTGAALGALLYLGLVKIPIRYFFSVTSWLILLLAAGLAANGAKKLAQAGVLPDLGQRIWDTSWLLSDDGVIGEVLHILVGYTATPSGIQLVFYAATIAIVGALMLRVSQKVLEIAKKAVLVLIASGFAAPVGMKPAEAGPPKVYSPIVQKGELELEHRGILDADNEAEFIYEAGYGVTDHWLVALFVEGVKEPGEPYETEAVALENIIQLTEQGQYFVDVGLYLEYEVAAQGGEPDHFEGKILLEKTTGRLVHTANLVFENETGANAAPGTVFELDWKTRYLFRPWLEFGFEAFNEFGQLGHFRPLSGQEHRIGPAVFGKFHVGKKSFLAYEAGYLVGLTASSHNAFRWLVEYEQYF